jgi:hypothetical protein
MVGQNKSVEQCEITHKNSGSEPALAAIGKRLAEEEFYRSTILDED